MVYASLPYLRLLATTLISGPWQTERLVARCENLLGKRRWVRPLVERLVVAMPPGRRPSLLRVIQHLEDDSRFLRASARSGWKSVVLELGSAMEPFSGRPQSWDVPPITTCDELAAWLDVEPRQLDWFADRRFLERSTRYETQGFEIHTRKTRRMNRSQRQQAVGLVINQHLNLARGQYDQLKATLYNCVRNGPDGENREGVADFRSHLEGRVHYFTSINPARAAKLEALLRKIIWP